MTDRIISGEAAPFEPTDKALRPQTLAEFVGQAQTKANLKVFIDAARERNEALDHVLLLAATADQPRTERDVLFIDEIHRLATPAVEEILYPAMEDHVLDLIIGEGPAARSVRIDLAPEIHPGGGADHGLGPAGHAAARPLRHSRCGWNFYTVAELELVVTGRGAQVMGIPIAQRGRRGARSPRRARGTPRVAGRLLRRVRDFAAGGGARS
jgi:Holliday junction DNA helicase RuvB